MTRPKPPSLDLQALTDEGLRAAKQTYQRQIEAIERELKRRRERRKRDTQPPNSNRRAP